jgi:hypothetical protein
MSSSESNPNDLPVLRVELAQIRGELKRIDSRVSDLEKMANRAVAAQQALAPPVIAKPVVPPPIPKYSPPEPAKAIKAAAVEAMTHVRAPSPPPLPTATIAEPAREEIRRTLESAFRLPTSAFKKLSLPKEIDWEAVIGGRWMTWVGAFTLLLAIGFAIHWAWMNLETPPWLRVSAFHLLGVGFLAGAHFLNRRGTPLTVKAFVGLGIFTLYGAAFAALHLYKLWSEDVAFVECAGITALAIGLALRANSPAVVLLGALGGYLTPIVTSSGSGNYAGLFTYLAFLNVALVACAVWRGWSFLKPLTLAATAAMFAGWLVNSHFDPTNNSMVWGTEWFVAAHGLIFLIGSTLPPVLWKRPSRPADLSVLSVCSLLFVGITWYLFRNHPGQQLAVVSWGMSALHAALFGLTFARVTNVDRMPRIHLALAAVFFTLAIPLQINDAAYWSATWCAEAFVFTVVGVYFADRQICTTSTIVLLLAAGRLIGWDLHAPGRLLSDVALDLRFVMFLIAGLMTVLTGSLYRLIPWVTSRPPDSPLEEDFNRATSKLLSAVGAALITLAPVLQFDDSIHLAPYWAVEAAAFTILGQALRDSQFRLTGLFVFILAAGRLIAFDFNSPARIWNDSIFDLRFVVFFFVGLLSMLAAWTYRLIPWLAHRKADASPAAALDRNFAGILSAIGATLITLAPMLQLRELTYLAPIWAIEGLIFTILGLVLRDVQLRVSGVVVFALAAGRLVQFDFNSAARSWGDSNFDLRFVAFAFAGVLSMLAAWTYRLIPWLARRKTDTPFDAAVDRGLAGLLSAIGATLITLAPMLQLADLTYLAPIWAVEALVFTLLGLSTRDLQLRLTGLIVFGAAAGRLIGFDFTSKARPLGNSTIDLRSAAFFWVGILSIICAAIYRVVYRAHRSRWREHTKAALIDGDITKLAAEDFALIAPAVLICLGALLVTCSPPLQLADWTQLGPVWAIEALLFIVLSAILGERLLAILGLAIFIAAGARILPWDFGGPAHLISGTPWDARFVVMEVCGVVALAAGGLYWLIPRILKRAPTQDSSDRAIGGLLAAAGNVTLMLGLTCQWETRLVLIAWTIDAALVWAVGFWLNHELTRWYAALLAIAMVGGRAVYDRDHLDGTFQLLFNSRFISLALVSALYFAAGGFYRRRRLRELTLAQQSAEPDIPSRNLSVDVKPDESFLDPLLGILANSVLLVAISLEIHSWYLTAIDAGRTPFPDMRMAEMATYSIVWAIYAALMVAAGFAIRYKLFRILGLAAFGVILAKVFFIDLESLQWLPRVLALAVLGIMLLGVSMLYQKFTTKLNPASSATG